ncbi:MAG: flagellar filament capping protein FliD [Oscillospiraceae bacterium]|nr:flagellar filament capping protein FliD [Oscillospiraceae bacterium]
MAVNGTNLRIGGLHSGLDTEAIVNAMSAATKQRINNNKRKVKKLEAQQAAYRDVISKLQGFQNKYLNVVNRNFFLKGTTIFNQNKPVTTFNGETKTPNGVSVSSGTGALPGNYTVTLKHQATQATLKSAAADMNVKFGDLDALADGERYAFFVSVGGTKKYIEFEAGASVAETVENINEKLEVFGKTNLNTGLVTVDTEGKLSSADKSQISVSGIVNLSETATIRNLNGFGETADYTYVDILIDGEIKTIGFNTLNAGYFDILGEDDAKPGSAGYDAYITGLYDDYVTETENAGGTPITRVQYESNFRTKYNSILAEFNNAAESAYNKLAGAEYDDWKDTATPTDKADLRAQALAARQETQTNGFWTKFFDEHKDAYTYATVEDMRLACESNTADPALQDIYDAAWDDFVNNELTTDGTFTAYNEFDAYKQFIYGVNVESFEDFKTGFIGDAVRYVNENNVIDAFKANSALFKDITISLEIVGDDAVITAKDESDNPVSLAISSKNGVSANFDNADDALKLSATSVTTSTKLSELGVDFDKNGQATVKINGKEINLTGNMTVAEMVNAINNSGAGVTLVFSPISNTFTLTSKDYGTTAKTEIDSETEDEFGIMRALGFNGGAVYTPGENMELEINGETVEVASNAYTINGTTFSFSPQAVIGETFETTVSRDYSTAVNAIKSFVEDYNKLIEEVYGYLKEAPPGYSDPSAAKYYFLTDDDIEEMGLSERQIEQWEIAAKKGILYNDSTVSTVMEKMRAVMYSGITASDGKTFGLYSIRGNDGTSAITAASDYKKNGMLEFDEQALIEALERNPDDIIKLFTDTENGLMKKLEDTLNFAVKSTGAKDDMGILVQKAGVSTGLSAISNDIFSRIADLNEIISKLEDRYEKQQDRYWKIFSRMEGQFSQLNSQSSFITNMFSSMNG